MSVTGKPGFPSTAQGTRSIPTCPGCAREQELPPLPASPTKASKQADAALPSAALPPKTHLVCTYCSEWAPLTGTPTQAGANGSYAYDFASRFRRDADIDGLHDLLNGTLLLSVHDSATNTLLASTTVDTLDFGLGHQAIELDALPLEPNPAVPPSCAKVVSLALPPPIAAATQSLTQATLSHLSAGQVLCICSPLTLPLPPPCQVSTQHTLGTTHACSPATLLPLPPSRCSLTASYAASASGSQGTKAG